MGSSQFLLFILIVILIRNLNPLAVRLAHPRGKLGADVTSTAASRRALRVLRGILLPTTVFDESFVLRAHLFVLSGLLRPSLGHGRCLD